jgi:hypothetical protein
MIMGRSLIRMFGCTNGSRLAPGRREKISETAGKALLL